MIMFALVDLLTKIWWQYYEVYTILLNSYWPIYWMAHSSPQMNREDISRHKKNWLKFVFWHTSTKYIWQPRTCPYVYHFWHCPPSYRHLRDLSSNLLHHQQGITIRDQLPLLLVQLYTTNSSWSTTLRCNVCLSTRNLNCMVLGQLTPN